MEFIRHDGDLQCSNSHCNDVHSRRLIYYCWHEGHQVYWFVCGKCGEWTRLAFGYEEIGSLAPVVRKQNAKIRDFDVSRYGMTW